MFFAVGVKIITASPCCSYWQRSAARPRTMDVLEKVLGELDTSLNEVEGALEPFLTGSLAGAAAKLEPLEASRLHASLATSVLALASGEFWGLYL